MYYEYVMQEKNSGSPTFYLHRRIPAHTVDTTEDMKPEDRFEHLSEASNSVLLKMADFPELRAQCNYRTLVDSGYYYVDSNEAMGETHYQTTVTWWLHKIPWNEKEMLMPEFLRGRVGQANMAQVTRQKGVTWCEFWSSGGEGGRVSILIPISKSPAGELATMNWLLSPVWNKVSGHRTMIPSDLYSRAILEGDAGLWG